MTAYYTDIYVLLEERHAFLQWNKITCFGIDCLSLSLALSRLVRERDVLNRVTWLIIQVMQDTGPRPNVVHLQRTAPIIQRTCQARTSGTSEAFLSNAVTSDLTVHCSPKRLFSFYPQHPLLPQITLNNAHFH